MKFSLALSLYTFLLFTHLSHAEQTTVAVASNFTGAMDKIVTAFEASSGHKVKVAYGATGKIYAQINNGAPFDAFFSADQNAPQKLENEGLALPNSRFTYAIGALALWSATTKEGQDNLARLQQGDFNKLALANPKLAPYGVAAVEVLTHLSLKESTEKRWVQGENIAQTYQFVGTGNADLGFVALSQIMENGQIKRGSAWIIPSTMHSPIRQDAVQLIRSKNNIATAALLAFMHSPEAQTIMRAYGYQTSSITQ